MKNLKFILKSDFIQCFLIVLFMFALIFGLEAQAGTCTSISRTNYSANSVLTSSSLNSQLNTVYNQINALDGGCITDATLELAAFGTDIDPFLNAAKQGCKVEYSSASAVTIAPCLLGVNGALVNTSTSTSLSMGCGSCSAESASAWFYVYVQDGSTGTTLNAILSTTAPDQKGLNSNDRVLAKIYNNASQDIVEEAIYQFNNNKFESMSQSISMQNSGGFGSTDNKIERFTTYFSETGGGRDGPLFTQASTSASAHTYTFNEDDIEVTACMQALAGGSGGLNYGLSLNSNQLTTDIESITASHQLCEDDTSSASGVGYASCCKSFTASSGDILRSHNAGTTSGDQGGISIRAFKREF